tara:strand:- start:3030 stop:4076 length:1047 start_codon:yes stop_codon:yes gene_type:complete
MRIEDDIKLTFDDVLIRPKRSTLVSRAEVELTRSFKFKHTNLEWSGVPIISANMDTTGTFETAEVLSQMQVLTALHKFYSIDDWENKSKTVDYNYTILTIGSKENEIENAQKILSKYQEINFICLDVANGYREDFIQAVSRARSAFPEKIIIAGNVATREMTEALILAGADIVKVGIGPGSVCTTRNVAGVGYPQLSAIAECSDAAHGLGGHVIADGGCKYIGDIPKAFGAGADFVMLGGMLAGHDESGGELVTDSDGNTYKDFYGMSSKDAQLIHYGDYQSYRAPEGKRVKLAHKGPIKITIKDILGGIRSACSYVGAKNIKALPKCTTFIRVTQTTNEIFNGSDNT